ncbi:MAG: hypothetical protein IJ389_02020 [Clostridia bacterium]|nr:hypothetical protein [Clostridia bacterium]
MKKLDLTYLSKWLPAVTIASAGYSFFGVMSLVPIRMIFDSVRIQSLTAYIIGTVFVCAVVGKISWDLGIELNNKRVPYPSDVPMANLVLGALIFWGGYIILEIQPFIPPLSGFLSVFVSFMTDITGIKLTFSDDGGTLQNIGVYIGLSFLQVLIYTVVSAFFYIRAKLYQDNRNEAVRKLRAEYQAENKKDDDPISQALKNGLGNRRK